MGNEYPNREQHPLKAERDAAILDRLALAERDAAIDLSERIIAHRDAVADAGADLERFGSLGKALERNLAANGLRLQDYLLWHIALGSSLPERLLPFDTPDGDIKAFIEDYLS